MYGMHIKNLLDTTIAAINYKEQHECEWDALDIDELYYMHRHF